MLTKDKAGDIFERIKKCSTGDEVEAIFYGGNSALTRFANNTIHQNVAEENYGVSVRTVFGGRTARASTNKLDDESLQRVVRSSESLAKVQHPDPDLLPMASPGENPAELAACLDGLRRRRGLSYEAMERAAARLPFRSGRSRPEPLPKSTVGETVTGKRLPAKGKLLTDTPEAIESAKMYQTLLAKYGPQGVAVDSAGNLYIADTENNRVRQVTPGGAIR